MTGVDLLICAEDPGAANFLAPLAAALEAEGLTTSFLAHPRIMESLDARGVAFERLDPDSNADDLIVRHDPAMLLVGTAEFYDCLGLQLIDAARRAAVPSVAVVDMAANAGRRFRGLDDDPLGHAPDWLALCDQATCEDFTALGFPHERMIVCGHPHFDVVRKRRAGFKDEGREALRRRLFPGAGDRKIIVFVAEGIDRLDPSFSYRSSNYSLAGRGASNYRTALVLEEFLDAAARLPRIPYITLRLHPKNEEAEFTAYGDEIDLMSAGGDPLPLIWAADAVVGMTSMLLVEAYLLGRPTLAIVPRREEAALIVTTANGLTPVATTRAAVRAGVADLFDTDSQRKSDTATSPLYTGALARMVGFLKARLDAECRSSAPSVCFSTEG